jgi:poly(A) polymerase
VTAAATRLADAAWLRAPPLTRLLDVLGRNGEDVRVVGGAVRNALIGEPIGEIDLATTALPEEVMRRVTAAGMKAVPTGVAHGTVTVVVEGVPYEVTTLREDVETYGRHAKVAFGRDWKRDAERRDFTMNALTASADGTVYDHVGGLADLKARRVRFIGDPGARIAEDYLRILRFFRFHAAYGHGGLPDAAGLAACVAARNGLDQLSRERVRSELVKLMLAAHATPTLAVMAETGLLISVLGGVALLASFENMVKVEAAAALKPDATRRLGALGVFVSEDAERLWQRLRLTNAEHVRLASLGDAWWRIAPTAADRSTRALLYRLGGEKFTDRVLLAWARAWEEGAADARWRALATLPERWTIPTFPLKAADFIARGIEKGPALGAALKAAEDAWISADFPDDRAKVAAIADAAVAAAGA